MPQSKNEVRRGQTATGARHFIVRRSTRFSIATIPRCPWRRELDVGNFSHYKQGQQTGRERRKRAHMLKRMRTYLGVIFAIFARDVKRVLRNPVALVIALGMIVMPSAYAWYVVAANWDPYSNTADMLVAVANEDAGADSPETGHLDVGAQVVAQLHDNHEMGWEFTDAEAAINGVYEGRYWAALVIPKDFSEDFASVFTGDFTQPTIDYYVNEKPSSIAPKVTDAAANAVEAAVNENFVKTVSEKVVETTQKVGAEAEEKADAAEGSLTAGVRSAKETVGETHATLEGLVGTVDDTRTSVARADDTLAGLQDDVPHLLEAIGQSKELLAKARSTVNEYGTALSKNATDGALQLSSAAAQAQRALGTVSSDVAAAEAATNTALATAEGLLADNKTLVSDLTAQAGAAGADPAIAQALSEARAANERLTTTTDALRTASDDLASTADSLETEASALDTAAQSASETIRATAATFQDSVLPDITTSLDSLVEACGTLEGALRGLTPSLAEARAILGQLGDTLTSSETSLSTTSDSLGTMETNLEQSLTDLTALQNSATVKDLAEYLKADPEKISREELRQRCCPLLHEPGPVGGRLHPHGHGEAARRSGGAAEVHRRAGLLRTLAVLRGVRAGHGARLLRGRFGPRDSVRKSGGLHRRGAAHGVRGREPHVRAGLRI